MDPFLAQITPFVVGALGFAVGLVIALRQRIARKRLATSERDQVAA